MVGQRVGLMEVWLDGGVVRRRGGLMEGVVRRRGG